jgi:uncharacterized repeat protein (TIGR02543 family)
MTGSQSVYLYAIDTDIDTNSEIGNKTVTIPTKHTISYNANGGTGAPSSQTKIEGTALTLSSTKPTLTGYTFLGWSTSATGTVIYQPGDSYTKDQDGGTVTLYAIWKEIQYGDVNNDNVIDELDAALVMKHISNIELLNSDKYNLSAADCNKDGDITILDVIWILNNKSDN